jgi:hypothetical protein
MRVNHRETDLENHDRGLDYDLPRLLHRRGMLRLVAGAGLAGAGLIALGACADATGSAGTPPEQAHTSDRRMARYLKRHPARFRATVPTVRMC